MARMIAVLLLLIAAGTALLLGRQHRPIALAFGWFIATEFALTQPLPHLILYVAVATSPAAIVAAAWAALQPRVRSYSPLLFGFVGGVATLVAVEADRIGNFGQAMGYLWVGCAMAGAAALIQSEAPAPTRSVVVALLFSLPGEAVGWVTWGGGLDVGYEFARLFSTLMLAYVIVIQAGELVTWPRFWRGAESSEATTKEEPPRPR